MEPTLRRPDNQKSMPKAPEQRKGGGAGPCKDRNLIRSMVLEGVARGDASEKIARDILSFAKQQGDLGLVKAACFQLLDKVCCRDDATSELFQSILTEASSIYQDIPTPAQERMLELATEIAVKHNFGIVSLNDSNLSLNQQVTRELEKPSTPELNQPLFTQPLFFQETSNQSPDPPDSPASFSGSGIGILALDYTSSMAARDALKRIDKQQEQVDYLSRSRLLDIVKPEDPLRPNIDLPTRSEITSASPVLAISPKDPILATPLIITNLNRDAPVQNSLNNRATDSLGGNNMNKDNVSFEHKETAFKNEQFTSTLALPKQTTKKPDTLSDDFDEPDKSGSVIPVFLASDKGQELIRRLVEKLKSHGKETEPMDFAAEPEGADAEETVTQEKSEEKKSDKKQEKESPKERKDSKKTEDKPKKKAKKKKQKKIQTEKPAKKTKSQKARKELVTKKKTSTKKIKLKAKKLVTENKKKAAKAKKKNNLNSANKLATSKSKTKKSRKNKAKLLSEKDKKKKSKKKAAKKVVEALLLKKPKKKGKKQKKKSR